MKLRVVDNFNQNGGKRLQHRSMGSSVFLPQGLAHVSSASELNATHVVGSNKVIKVVLTAPYSRYSNQKLQR